MRGRIARALALVALAVVGLAGCGQATSSTVSKAPAPGSVLKVVVSVSANQMAQTVAGLGARAQRGLGVKDASDRNLSATEIEVDLPGYTDKQAAVAALTTQGVVRFFDTDGTPLTVGTTVTAQQYPTLFTGSQIDPASVGAQTDQSGQPIVTFAFNGAAAAAFAQYTGSHIGQYLTITLDNRVIESATIQSQIAGQGQVSGIETMAQALALAACLKSAPLPGPVTLVSAVMVAPTGA